MVSAKRCSPTMARRELKIGLTSEIRRGVNKVTTNSQNGRLVMNSLRDAPEDLKPLFHRRYRSSGTMSQKAPPYCKNKSASIENPGFFTHATPSAELLIWCHRVGAQRNRYGTRDSSIATTNLFIRTWR